MAPRSLSPTTPRDVAQGREKATSPRLAGVVASQPMHLPLQGSEKKMYCLAFFHGRMLDSPSLWPQGVKPMSATNVKLIERVLLEFHSGFGRNEDELMGTTAPRHSCRRDFDTDLPRASATSGRFICLFVFFQQEGLKKK